MSDASIEEQLRNKVEVGCSEPKEDPEDFSTYRGTCSASPVNPELMQIEEDAGSSEPFPVVEAFAADARRARRFDAVSAANLLLQPCPPIAHRVGGAAAAAGEAGLESVKTSKKAYGITAIARGNSRASAIPG